MNVFTCICCQAVFLMCMYLLELVGVSVLFSVCFVYVHTVVLIYWSSRLFDVCVLWPGWAWRSKQSYVLVILYIFISTWWFYMVILYGAVLLCSRPVPQSPRIPELDSWTVIGENRAVQGLSFPSLLEESVSRGLRDPECPSLPRNTLCHTINCAIQYTVPFNVLHHTINWAIQHTVPFSALHHTINCATQYTVPYNTLCYITHSAIK